MEESETGSEDVWRRVRPCTVIWLTPTKGVGLWRGSINAERYLREWLVDTRFSVLASFRKEDSFTCLDKVFGFPIGIVSGYDDLSYDQLQGVPQIPRHPYFD